MKEGDSIAIWAMLVSIWLIALTLPTSSELKQIAKEVKCEVGK